ncbi:MAG: methylmalonyl Co-A mutase-associated GTPase MeaB [Actinomycetota bacterium]|nr:methylmalonyl Co-A mutase-associated GTPase MeaB [Actinomycetota bacterium]
MKDSLEILYKRLLKGDKRACARLITMVENRDERASDALKFLHRHSGRAYIIGLTGSPGSGKSTLACSLAAKYRRDGKSVGIIAVDPTSPFTGGALLGDRVRMQELSEDPDVFIRSMGSRGSLGGLSVATDDAITVLDASGKDYIIVETVGAGQVEVEIVKFSHTCIVVTMPGGGDEIQAIKAGILEIADIFVVNKADREGAQRTISDLEMMLEASTSKKEQDWVPPIVATVAIDGSGVDELAEAISNHRDYLVKSGRLAEIGIRRMKAELLENFSLIMNSYARRAFEEDRSAKEILEELSSRKIDPHTAAERLAKHLLKNL